MLKCSRNVSHLVQRFSRDEDGTTAIEYAFIASLLVIGIISTIQLMGESVHGLYDKVNEAFP